MPAESGLPQRVWLKNWRSAETPESQEEPADPGAPQEEAPAAPEPPVPGGRQQHPGSSMKEEAVGGHREAASILEEAVRRLAERLSNAGAGEFQEERALQELETLSRLAYAGLSSDSQEEAGSLDGAQAVLLCELADALRRELLLQWTSNPGSAPAPETLRALGALESVRSRVLPDVDHDVVARLAQPSGLELVVEVAHDIRSPLTSILFLSEALRGGHSGEVNEVQRRQLGLIYSAALGLISIAGDVMELAKGGTRLSDEAPAAFSVSEVLDSVREMVLPMAEEKGLVLRMVPPDQDQYMGYPTPLSRVLLNLTTNALKFTEEGFVEVEARDVRRGLVMFSVRDTGRGMDRVDVEKLYQPFRRASHKDGYLFSGTGLGLSIARRLVEAMGSTLEVETRRNWGTRFHFQLELPPTSHL